MSRAGSPRRSPKPAARTRTARRACAGLALSAALAGLVPADGPARAAALQLEAPMLAEAVAAGSLPRLEQRIPAHPRVMSAARGGRYGGEMRMLMGRSKDVRMMTVYGYARLVVFDRDFKLVPDILESFDVEEGRIFTLHLRKGHRWSDGAPFTSEDFRYWWEDIATDKDLSPFGPPPPLLAQGTLPKVEFPDAHTVRYSWVKPNPFFLPALAGSLPEYIYAPAHYLKAFHARYADRAALDAQAQAEGQQDWTSVHVMKDQPYKNSNPDLPTLQPWQIVTESPASRFEFVRNPYYHRVDAEGRQLPYLDGVTMTIADGKLIPAKTGAGEADLQARNLSFSDYTFLKSGAKRSGFEVRLWTTTRGSHIALFPNLNVTDPVWRALVRDVRFRRALSLAIDRHEVNQVIYFGLAVEGNNTVHEGSPLFEPGFRSTWATYDPEKASALLDEIGLTRRDARGIRLLPDGRPLEIIVETAGEDTEQSDVLELISSTWFEVGIKLFTKPLQREVLRSRVFAGKTVMSVWSGLENGLPTADTSPLELAPSTQQQLQWPMWGQYYESSAKLGEAPPVGLVKALHGLEETWLASSTTEQRTRIWREMLGIHAEQQFSIGIVASVPQPVVVSKSLHNVPAKGIYNWEPGAYFGVYGPDTFWMDPAGR